MLNDYMKSVLQEMAGLIVDLETQREQIEAAFVEPDVCANCKSWSSFLGLASGWSCNNPKSPLYPGYSFCQWASHKLCCIHFEQREVEK